MVNWDLPSITQDAWPANYLTTLKINDTVQTVTTLKTQNQNVLQNTSMPQKGCLFEPANYCQLHFHSNITVRHVKNYLLSTQCEKY
jgi:hypothetical protein